MLKIAEKVKAALSGNRFIIWYLWGMVFLMISGLFIIAATDKTDGHTALLDYMAYVFPCCAGVIAGLGVYYEGYAKLLFSISCLVLTLGMACYISEHGEALFMVAIAICGAIALLLAILLKVFLIRASGEEITTLNLLEVLLLGLLLGLAIFVITQLGGEVAKALLPSSQS